jgi:hypothetical protein
MENRSDTTATQAGREHHEHSHAIASIAPKRRTRADLAHIPGWGSDLDLKNRPAVPMERTPPRLEHPPPPLVQQKTDIEVFVSPERPSITPVFGTSVPPSGISGMIRRAAFKTTENDIRHWLLLLVADRVNVVEGIVQDLSEGRVPNVLAEMGVRAELRHNPAGLVKKAAITTAVVGTAWYLLTRRNSR